MLTAIHIAEEVCSPVAQRQVVLTIPKRLRLHTRFDMERLLVAWQDALFALYLAEEIIEPAVVENMRSWEHSGL